MDVRNCRNCGQIYNHFAGPNLCQVCKELMEEKFQEVKKYVREHPGVGIPQVAAACEVETAQIKEWLRDERLEVTEDSPMRLSCEGCGADIRSGTYCEKCKSTMTKEFTEILDEYKPKQPEPKKPKKVERDKERMRYL